MPTAFTSIFITTRDARVIIGGAMHGDSYRPKAAIPGKYCWHTSFGYIA
tara:strand:- start:468 stop:614 length:147 start_codon:yes stop_codon:yes gene_type:complete